MLKFTRFTPVRCAVPITGLSLALSACSGTTLGHFDSDENLPETRIESSAIASFIPSVLPSQNLDVSSSESFQQEEFDYLTSIEIEALSLEITDSSTDTSNDTLEDGEPDNFNFMSGVDIYIEAEFDGQTNRELIGSVPEDDSQLTDSVQTLNFTMTGLDVLDYVEAESGYSVQIQASGESPPDAVIFDGEVSYRVGIGFR